VSPRQDAAFVTAADGTFHVFRIQSGATSELALNGVTAVPERVVFSPSGTAAALYGGGSVQIVTGLPDVPAIASSVAVQPLGSSDSLALSDDGAALLVASGNSVELFGGAADLGKVADTAGPALAAFGPGSHDAAIVDRGGAGIVLYRGLTGTPGSQVLAATDDTIGAATAVAFSTDGGQVMLASGQSVTLFDAATGGRNAVACSCTPSTLARMGNVFLLNDLSSAPLWLLDASTGDIKFVPASAPVARRPTPTRNPRPVRGPQPVLESTGAALPARRQTE
jgi:hypothetical protein